MNVLVAVRTGNSCSIGVEVVLSNLLLRTMSRIGAAGSEKVSDRMFTNGMIDVNEDEVDALMNGVEPSLVGDGS